MAAKPAPKRPRMAYTASAAAATEADEADQQVPESFISYYAAQALCSTAEWEETLRLLRRPLLLSVRVNRCIAGDVEAALSPLRAILHDSLKPIPWMPAAYIVQAEGIFAAAGEASGEEACADPATEEGGGRHFSFEQAVQHALIMGMKSGELAQQEVTSMIPALLLSPQPHHKVMDRAQEPPPEASPA